MIALKLIDDVDNVIEVSVQANMDDDSKNSVVIQIESSNTESGNTVSLFYYIDDKDQLNALIGKLIACKKQIG